jgi:polysaccharide export outer membrane protein
MRFFDFRIARRACAVISTVILLTGCITETTRSDLAEAPKGVAPQEALLANLEPYRFQIGDVVDIKVMMSPELNDQAIVRPDGMISTTIASDVRAYGRTPAELQSDLVEVYSKHLVQPRVSVIVRSFAPERIYVTGEVNAPGEFVTVGPNLTLLQAIARAGGVKNSAATDNIVIVRRGAGEKPVAYAANYIAAATGRDPASDVRLAPYDVVYVPRSGVGNAYLYFQQYFQQFIPDSASFGANYEINPVTTVTR